MTPHAEHHRHAALGAVQRRLLRAPLMHQRHVQPLQRRRPVRRRCRIPQPDAAARVDAGTITPDQNAVTHGIRRANRHGNRVRELLHVFNVPGGGLPAGVRRGGTRLPGNGRLF